MIHERTKSWKLQVYEQVPEAVECYPWITLQAKYYDVESMSEWDEPYLLSFALERFLALKPKPFGDTVNADPTPSVHSSTVKVQAAE